MPELAQNVCLFHPSSTTCHIQKVRKTKLASLVPVFGNGSVALRWRHNERDSISNHQPHDCLLNRLSSRRSKKTSKLRVTGLCVGNSPGTGEFPAQMASYAENVSIWWRHHGSFLFYHRSVSWRLKHLASLNLYVVPMWTWWRHQMETFSALLALCAGNSPVTDEFPLQRPLTRSFDVFFDLRLSKRLSKHSWDWWFETLSRPLLRHCNGISNCQISWSLEASKLGLDVSNCSQICKNEPTVKFHSDMVISMQI